MRSAPLTLRARRFTKMRSALDEHGGSTPTLSCLAGALAGAHVGSVFVRHAGVSDCALRAQGGWQHW